SAVAWTGTSVESDRKGAKLRVFRTTLLNPKPDVDVMSADYVSLLGQSSAYVFAIGISDDGPESKTVAQRSAPDIALLTFFLQEGANTPVANGLLDGIFECSGYTVRFFQAAADAAGKITLDVPTNS